MNLLKLILRPLKIVAIIVVVFVALVVGAVGLLNTSSVQDKFLSYATDMLQEKLQTKVSIDSIRIGFFSDDVRLYNPGGGLAAPSDAQTRTVCCRDRHAGTAEQ